MMPRKPRLHVRGGLYHVILRGNDRQPIFFEPADRRRWTQLLAEGIDRYLCRVHAFCWMTNHIHMAVQVSSDPLSRLIHWLAPQYARAINRRLGRSGHLFERRYLAKLVDSDSYLLELVRYIHLNPVRAQIVAQPGHYPWSSHRAYLGLHKPSWLTVDWVLAYFASHRKQARQAYAVFIADLEAAERARELFSGHERDARLVGSDRFVEQVTQAVRPSFPKPTLEQLIHEYCAANDMSETQLAARGQRHRPARVRALIAEAAQTLGVATVHEVAQRFNRSDAAISRSVSRLRRRARQTDQRLKC